MADAKPAASLQVISERLDRIEETLSRLDQVLSQVPGVVATATDMADEVAARAVATGVLPEERASDAARLLERMTRPETMRALEQLVSRVDALGLAADMAAPTAAMIGDLLDEWAMRASDRGIDLDDRVRRALHLMQRLTEPGVTSALESVLDRVARLTAAVEQLDALPGAIAMFVDTADDLLLAAAEQGIDVDTLARTGKHLMGRLARLMQSPELRDVLESGILEPRVVHLVAQIGQALNRALDEPSGRTGLLAMLRASRDPDVQRTIDFTMRCLRHLGSRLEAHEQSAIASDEQKELPHV